MQDRTTVDRNAGDIVQVIGAGLPRTGTSSLVAAMEILGFGPSFHFTEIHYDAGSAPIFKRILQAFRITGSHASKSKEELDAMKDQLKDIYRGYKCTLDNPSCHFVPELMDLYPHAKVLLSVRDSDEAWYKSVQDTNIEIGKKWWFRFLMFPIGFKSIADLARQCCNVIARYSQGKSRKENHSLHNQWIREIVPRERLLEVCTPHTERWVRVN